MRLSMLLILACSFALLVACGQPATQAPTPFAPTAPPAPATPTPFDQAPPTVTPGGATPTSFVPDAPTAAAPSPTTVTSAAPEAVLGYGHAASAAFVSGAEALVVATSAGVVLLSLPDLAVLRFVPLPIPPGEPAVSPGGQYFAVGQGEVSQVITTEGVTQVVVRGINPRWSPDGSLLAATGVDAATGRETTWLYAVPGGEQVAALDGGNPHWSPDGATLVTFADGAAIFSGVDGVERERRPADAVSFAAAAPLVVVTRQDGLAVHEFSQGAVGREIFGVPALARSVAIAADGSRLYAWSDGEARVWSLPEGAELAAPAELDLGVGGFGPGGLLVWSTGGGGESPTPLQVRRTANGELLHLDRSLNGGGRAYFNDAGDRLAVIDLAGELQVYDLEQGRLGGRVLAGYDALALTPEGALVAARRYGTGLDLWTQGAAGDGPARSVALELGAFAGVRELAAEGRRVVVDYELDSYLGGQFVLGALAWEPDSAAPPQRLRSAEIPGDQLAIEDRVPWDFSPAAGLLARGVASSAGGGLLVDDPAGGEPRLLPELIGAPTGETPTSLAFSPDGARLAVGYGDGTLLLVQSADFVPVASGPLGEGEAITALAWSGDGRVLAFALAGGDVAVWEAGDDDAPLRFAAPRAGRGAPSLALSADGRLLAVGARGGEAAGGLAVYSLARRAEAMRLPVSVDAIALAPDGTQVAASVGGQIVVWAVAP